FRDLGAMVGRGGASAPAEAVSSRLGAVALVAGSVVVVVVGRAAFGLHPLTALVAVALALVLAVVSSRATGETDLAPVGPLGTLVQLGFGRSGTTISVLAGSVSMGTSSQAAQTLWAFKAGQRLGASPRAQLLAQLLGALLGGLVVVPVYLVVVKAYGIGTESLPAPAALTWRATAEAARGGLANLPAHAALAGAVGLGVGVLLSLAGRARWGRFLPSPAAMGIAVVLPASISLAALIGAAAAGLAGRLRPSLDQESLTSLAAGGIAGESVVGVLVAALIATGVFR
ncbi:MAG TPA: OPT/YSL family transporter, partial [Polyangia bacterium]|nr:OPT/YSL family transporter [Polyangia bacterium]